MLKHLPDLQWPGRRTVALWTTGYLLLLGLTLKEFVPLLDDYQHHNFVTQIEIAKHNSSSKPPTVSVCIEWRGHAFEWILNRKVHSKFANGTSWGAFWGVSWKPSDPLEPCHWCDALADRPWGEWTSVDLDDDEEPPAAFYATEPERMSADDMKRLATFWDKHKARLSTAFVRKLLENEASDSFEVLDTANADWNEPLVDAVFYFLTCVSAMDVNSGTEDTGVVKCGWCLSPSDLDFVLERKDKIKKLYDRMTRLLCQYIGMYDSNFTYFGYQSENVCERVLSATPSLFLRDQFCFQLPLDRVSHFAVSSIAAVDRTKSGFVSSSTAQNASSPWPSAPRWSLSTTKVDVISDTEYISWPPVCRTNSHLVHVTKDPIEQVEIDYSTSGRVIETRKGVQCYSDTCPAVCTSRCVLERIVAMCACVPFSYRNHVTKSIAAAELEPPFCTSAMYDRCAFNQTAERNKCNQRCANPCGFVLHNWHSTIINKGQWSKDEAGGLISLGVTFQPVYSTYLEFSIAKKNTEEQFLSQIGAIFSFYLGFSGMSVVALVVWSVNRVLDHRSNSGRFESTTQSHVEQKMEEMKQDLMMQVTKMMTQKLTEGNTAL